MDTGGGSLISQRRFGLLSVFSEKSKGRGHIEMGGGRLDQVNTVLEKHKRYGDVYVKDDFFWGIGIECESYFEMSSPVEISGDFVIKNHRPERYSVNYYTSYKPDLFQSTLELLTMKRPLFRVPLLINAHVLTKTDKFLEHETLYKKGTPPNPKFQGKTIFENLKIKEPDFFEKLYETNYTFDGDSIEIMTQDFYKATIKKVFTEFTESRKRFQNAIQGIFADKCLLHEHGTIQWAKQNYGFAVMATNQNNLAIFNNGTYHINLTLPTQLNSEGKIADFPLFEKQHCTLIRYIQWLEPLLVGVFGSADSLSAIRPDLYSAGSQRAAMSRYIGLGSYDTSKMEKGKIVSIDVDKVRSSWYTNYHKNSGYEALKTIGLDINFNKHWNHGVEIRFFDWFPEGRLLGLLHFLVFIMDVSIDEYTAPDPLENPIWNTWMERVIHQGAAAGCTGAEAAFLTKILCVETIVSRDLNVVFADLFHKLSKKWRGKGPCSALFLSDELKVEPAVAVVATAPVRLAPVKKPWFTWWPW
jgi:hypothetical protein